jgi:hypothetical protein
MAGALFEPPYYPIIYVRGYAGTDSEIEDTVSDPYMGFNLGSTRIRTLWTGDTERYYFESPLVRLMKDFKYSDVYSAGLNITEIDQVPPGTIEPDSDCAKESSRHRCDARAERRRMECRPMTLQAGPLGTSCNCKIPGIPAPPKPPVTG